MAPRAKTAPAKNDRGQPRIGATPIVKPRQASGTRKSLRSPPIPPAPISQTVRTKRKRPQDSEAEADHPAKQPRRSTRPRLEPFEENLQKDSEAEAKADEPEPPPQAPLSEEDLQSLYKEVMNHATTSAATLKRTSSRRSIVPSETGTDRTQRSSNTNAFYRHKHLKAVQIHIHAEPPDCIKAAVNRIVNAKVSKQRRAELRVIGQKLLDDCLKNVRAQSGEDDFIDPLHTALKALGIKNLCVHEKADWREELKPTIQQQSHFSSSFMTDVQQLEVDDVSARPRKRQQQAAGGYISPESSQSNAPTPPPANHSQEPSTIPPPRPPVPKEGDRYPIKTPRPDLSIGTDLTALISFLSSQNLNKTKAAAFIDWLQNELVQHEPGGPLEPMLILVPAPRALDLTFPFAVVEGKAYSTGKQIFEAENQAGVSGACALKIQLDLDSLVNSGTTTPSNTQPPLFFTITTQGPIHELWYHWTVVEDDVRKFESRLLDSYNALVLERGEELVVRLNNVGVWGTGPFVKSVVERLGKVAVKAAA